MLQASCLFTYFKKYFISLFLERGEGREKEMEKNIDVQELHQLVTSCTPLVGDLACNAVMCPGWESNQQPLGLWAGTQSTEPHQPGCKLYLTSNSDGHF